MVGSAGMRRVEESVTERAALGAKEAPRPAALAAGGRGSAEGGRLGRYQTLFELARGGLGTVHVGRLVGAHGFDRCWFAVVGA